MDNVIAKLGRDNHLTSLMARLPLLTTVYGLQCILISNMDLGIDIGDFAVYMGISLIIFVSCLFVHDKYHHVLLFKDYIHIYFAPLNTSQKISYSDILEIIVPEEECDFSSIIIKLKDSQLISLHFVDYPQHVKKIINEIKSGTFHQIDAEREAKEVDTKVEEQQESNKDKDDKAA